MSFGIEGAESRPLLPSAFRFPQTRYQGSKVRLLPWLAHYLGRHQFKSALDVFGGTGAVTSLLTNFGARVAYNDYLESNAMMARALLQNPGVRLSESDLQFLFERHSATDYDDFIERTFEGVYFTQDENAWLDLVAQNIPRLACPWKRALAYYALFQACIIKRPYNLFHRKNLYMRLAQVDRSFGNKSSWDTPFPEHMRRFAMEANSAGSTASTAIEIHCCDARKVPGAYDLVYVDPPYLNRRGTGVDYFAYYHFLEGLLSYDRWADRINWNRKHLPLQGARSDWSTPTATHGAFAELFAYYRSATIVVSYRDNGIPSTDELVALLAQVKGSVVVHELGRFQYALSKDRASQEVLLVAE